MTREAWGEDGLPFWDQRITAAPRQPTPEMGLEELVSTLAILVHDVTVIIEEQGRLIKTPTAEWERQRVLLDDVRFQLAFLSGLAIGHGMRKQADSAIPERLLERSRERRRAHESAP